MKNVTNSGKKEQRQFNQILDKQAKEGRQGVKETEARTTPRQTASRRNNSK